MNRAFLRALSRISGTRSISSSSFARNSSQPQVFDRELKQRQRHWALSLDGNDYYDYLRKESAAQICERVEDITREFPVALDLGCHGGHLWKELNSRESLGGAATAAGAVPRVQTVHVSGDEENPLKSMGRHSTDLVLSNLSLHWVNDLASTLVQVREVLRPDGCFIGSLLGGSTLQELRYCLYLAEQERRGGVSPHASPLITPSDMAALMQGAKFALPTIDIETVTISYPDAFTLMEHLSLMGEGTAALNRQYHVGRDTFLAAAALYQQLYGLEDGSIPATFQMIYVIGWAPHESQPSCLKRGSATHSFKDINNPKTNEK
eukprot:GSChrysophyteH1.ASY1.ANO1.1257.1 assembled CDS